jgi:hypothetical protein
MLNTDTFKSLCIIAKTDRGKQIRKYYVKLENIYNKIIKQEIEDKQSQLEEKQSQLEETESQLATTQRELTKEKSLRNKMLNRRCFDVEDGNYIYIFQDNLNDPNSILITIAAKESGIPRSTLVTLIKFQTIKDNCTFKYI